MIKNNQYVLDRLYTDATISPQTDVEGNIVNNYYTSGSGLSNADALKLASIQTGAEVNQFAFSYIKVSSIVNPIAAIAKTDTLNVVGTAPILITIDVNKNLIFSFDTNIIPDLTTVTNHINDTSIHFTGTEKTDFTNHLANTTIHHTHSNKTNVLDLLTEGNITVLSHLTIIDNKLQINVDTYSTGELSAYGVGDGTSGIVMELKQLADVSDDLNPVNADLLFYDTSISKWINKPSSTITPDLTGYYTSIQTNNAISTAIANLVNSAPSTLDTLNELAIALGNDPNFATTITTLIGTKWTQDNTKISNWDSTYTKVQTFDTILSHFSIVDNKLQIDIDTYSTGELSAYGAGAGSGGSVLELKQLVDVVDTLSPVDKDLLYYDGTLGMWTTKASSSLEVDLTEITAKIPNWDLAYTNTHTHANKAILDAITSTNIPAIGHLFLSGSGTEADPYFLYTDVNFYSEKEVSAYGVGTGGGGSATSLSELTDVIDTLSPVDGDLLYYDITIDKWINKAATSLQPTLTNYYTKSESDSKYSLIGHTHSFSDITSKPTTLSGYGITDAALSSHTHAYLPLTGGTITGDLILNRQSINNWLYLQNADESNFYLRVYNGGTADGVTNPFIKLAMGYSSVGDNASINFYRGGGTIGGFLSFATNDDAERLRITASGNVLINTATDTGYLLNINGTGSFANTLYLNNSLSVVNNSIFKGTAAIDGLSLGTELLTTSGWTSTGWTGNYTSNFIHTEGNTNPLSNSMAAVSGNRYLITISTIDGGDGTITISFGGVSRTMSGDDTINIGVLATNANNFIITPTTDFIGTIYSLSIKLITNVITPLITHKDRSDNITNEVRSLSGDSMYYGKNAGRYSNGSRNTGIGNGALYNIMDGNYNTTLGSNSLFNLVSGDMNISIGQGSGQNITNGINNLFIGYVSGNLINTGQSLKNSTNSIFIGGSSRALLDNSINEIVIGAYAVGLGSNTISLGTVDTTLTRVYGNLYATGEVTAYQTSDINLKKNINNIESSLDIINELRPVTYNWNDVAKRINPLKTDNLDSGLIAQELEEILPNLVHTNDNGYKSIDYIKLIPYLIAAIKELKKEINLLNNID